MVLQQRLCDDCLCRRSLPCSQQFEAGCSYYKKSPPFVQALVSESFAGLLDPSPAARSAEEDPGDVMGPVKSVTEQLNDSATVVKLSYQSTAPLSSL